MLRVVVHTPDVVGERMAGPGIRAWHFADELSKHFDADVLLGQPARGFRRLRKTQRIVYDLFDPVLLELREMYGRAPSLRQRVHLASEKSRLKTALKEADLLLVAAPKQRELYKRKNIIEVSFGAEVAESGEPRAESLILWGGGIWEWLDPKTAVEATVKLNRDGVPCRLLFLGRSRPNRSMVDRRREDRFDRLVASGDPFVQANDEWVPYRERLSWLHRAKIA